MSYTLKDIKDGIFKALGEYSANGQRLGEMSYNRADLEHKIIHAINSALCRASMSLPAFTKSFMPRFVQNKCVYSESVPFEIKCGNTYKPIAGLYGKRFAFTLLLAGRACIKLCDAEGNTVFEKKTDAKESAFERVSFFTEELPEGKKTLEIIANGKSAAFRELDVYNADFGIDNEKLIAYRGYSAAELPCDFGSLEGYSVNGKAFCKSSFIINDGVILCPLGFESSVTVYYTPKCIEIDEKTSESTVIDMPDVTCLGVIYLAAAELCETGDGELYSRLLYKYRDIALNCYDKKYAPKVRNSFFEYSKGKLKEEAKCHM